jgi:hypothetical protein
MIEFLKFCLIGVLVIFFEIWAITPADTRGPYD